MNCPPFGVLFVQNRPHKAGAQSCLWRLLRYAAQHQLWQSLLLTSGPGWLVDACRAQQIPVLMHPFPSSRSLPARLYQNNLFAKEVHKLLEAAPFPIHLLQGNDHQEGILTLALAKRLQLPAALLLRDSGMRQEDYAKYHVKHCQWLATIGQELHDRVASWSQRSNISTLHDGLLPEEFYPPVSPSPTTPKQILVIGSAQANKGWSDLLAALQILAPQQLLQGMTVDFTGSLPATAPPPQLPGCQLRFIGRIEAFQELVRRYPLVINPSRRETFGMAAIEVLAAGVPLLSSRTGIIEQIVTDQNFLFPPGEIAALAERLRTLLLQWPQIGLDLPACQQRIQQRFPIAQTAACLAEQYARMLQRA
ncbi:glycosyltransferase family 4 protein [Candidatus Magnetaquicoccus inordinatus]|uniref:glycosyltransferase family 4 protein n=1 Tax=Candidatus Magnetaquicoccus inordinatus TaxID=2496818 RepID=UPI00102BCCEF|nr:glycosyltransferase [Candidatus Magnetaquicoccus inordinatus]